jgi:hypothetical protein
VRARRAADPAEPAVHAPAPRRTAAPPPRAGQYVKNVPVTGDALADMPEALRTAWGADLKLTAAQTLAALGAPDVYLGVEVRLVGFDGLG